MPDALGLGIDGHAKSVIDALQLSGRHEVVAMLDSRPALRGQKVMGVPIPGGAEQLDFLKNAGVRHAFVGVGVAAGGDTSVRKRYYRRLLLDGFQLIDVVHPSAVVAAGANSGLGVTVLALAVIGAEARLGVNVVVNTAAVVEPDCVLGDHVVIGSGALLAGGVRVHEGAVIGVGAVVRPGVTIGREAVVAAGSVVTEDVPPQAAVSDSPAQATQRRAAG